MTSGRAIRPSVTCTSCLSTRSRSTALLCEACCSRIVRRILALARTLNTSVVAEGIETEVQARELERLGCTHAQGFLFSKPLSIQSVEQLVMARKPLGPKAAAEAAQRAWSPRPESRV